MRHLLNTLFVTSEDVYLSLDGENVVANRGQQAVARYPLHTLSGIVTFSYAGASPGLMGACAQRDVSLAFCTPRGRFLARVCGESSGNVLLRRAQYRAADDPRPCCRLARSMVFGKVYNARWSIERTRRDHGLRVDDEALAAVSAQLKDLLPQIADEASLDSLRGLEGAAATAYFGIFDQLILGEKPLFAFETRNRRPPLDPVNALLSFAYSLLTNDCASASGERGAGRLCGLSPPGPAGADLPGAGSDGGTAAVSCRPVRPHSHQQPGDGQRGLRFPGERSRLSQRRRPADLPPALAGAKAGDHHPSLFEREAPLGPGPLHPGPAPGPNAPGRPGRLPALFVEVRRLCWF